MDKYDNVAHYRLDRITNIKLLPIPAKPVEQVKGLERGFDLPRHMAEHVYLFAGESGVVTFRAKKYLLNDIIDWLGAAIRPPRENPLTGILGRAGAGGHPGGGGKLCTVAFLQISCGGGDTGP